MHKILVIICVSMFYCFGSENIIENQKINNRGVEELQDTIEKGTKKEVAVESGVIYVNYNSRIFVTNDINLFEKSFGNGYTFLNEFITCNYKNNPE